MKTSGLILILSIVLVASGGGTALATGEIASPIRPVLDSESQYAPGANPLGGNDRGTLIENLDTSETFDAIQEAIDDPDTEDGDVLQFMSGVTTHVLAAQVVVYKAVTIIGVSGGTTTITPASNVFDTSGSAAAMFLVDETVDGNGRGAHFENLIIDGTYPTYKVGCGLRAQSDLTGTVATTITNCEIRNIRRDPTTYYGFGIIAYSSLTATGCTFENIGRVHLWSGDGPTIETTLTVTGCDFTGKGTGDHLDYAVELELGATGILTDNTITACLGEATVDGSISGGILATNYWDPAPSLTMNGNTVTGNTYGVLIGYDTPDATTCVANGNDFSGNVELGFSSISDIEVDATENWWGDTDPSDDVEGDVDYSPCWGADYVGDPHTTAWTWYVDDSIQDAIDAASAGDVVQVAAGTYQEQLHIAKDNLSIVGAGEGTTTILSPAALTLFFGTNFPIVFVDGCLGFEMTDLTVDGNGEGNANYRFVGVAFWNSGGSLSDLHVTRVMDTPFSGAQHGVGIYAYNDTGGPYTVNVTDVDVDLYQKNAFALSGEGLTANVTRVTTIGAGATDVTAQNGIQIGFGAGGTVTDCVVEDNAYTGASWGATGVLLYAGTSVLVSGTTADGNQTSIDFYETSGTVDDCDVINPLGDALYAESDAGPRGKGESSRPRPQPLDSFAYDRGRADVTVDVTNSTFTGTGLADSWGPSAVAYASTTNLTVSNCVVSNWDYGVVAYENGGTVVSQVNNNSLAGNTSYGFYTNATVTQDGELNWWGDDSGPGGAGPGSGTPASAFIDFDPWIGQAGGENVVCDPEPLELTEAVGTASLDVDYLGGGSAGVRGVHIVFTWDVTDVDLTGIVQGDLFGAEPSQFYSFIGTGTATVDWSLTGLPEEINPATGPGTIFTPTFAAVATCDSDVDPEIEFTEIVFRDAYNGNISGIYARDGEITVDTEDPVVAGVGYDNSLPHAEAFVKTGDTPTLSATVTDGCVATSILTISGDFSNLLTNAGWDDMAPTSLVGDDASWDFPTDDLAADGTYTVTLTATDLLGNEGTATFDITIDNTAPTAITAVAAAPGHNEVDLTWADPSGLDANYYAVELWRTAWGAYPEYDDTTPAPSYPVPPTTGTMVAGVPTGTLTSFTETFLADGSERDVYYYTAVVIDKALNKGPSVTSAQDRATNYWLGDVAPVGPPLGNGRVFSEDISVLSATYFKTSTDGGYDNTCDVGPTHDMSRTGIPDTDDLVAFEDLMVFSMNYDVNSPEGRNDGAPGGQSMPVALDLKVPSGVSWQPGARIVVSAVLSDESAAVKGAQFIVHYDEQALICHGVHEGALVADCGGFFKAFVQDGSADISAAAMGRGLTLGGSGTLAELVFEVRDGADPDLSLGDISLRNVANQELLPTTSTIDLPVVSTDVIPTNVFLGANRPNPFAGMTHVDFGLPTAAPVNLAVYDVSGRLVRTLINGELGAGEHSVQWDRTQADGTPVPGGLYFYRLETSNQVMTRKMIVSE